MSEPVSELNIKMLLPAVITTSSWAEVKASSRNEDSVRSRAEVSYYSLAKIMKASSTAEVKASPKDEDKA